MTARGPSRGKGSAFSHLIGLAGVLILVHAGYQTIQYREYLKLAEATFQAPPADVIVELLLGLLLCMWSALQVPGTFQPIRMDADSNRTVELPESVDFMTFNHRGRVNPAKLDVKFKAR